MIWFFLEAGQLLAQLAVRENCEALRSRYLHITYGTVSVFPLFCVVADHFVLSHSFLLSGNNGPAHFDHILDIQAVLPFRTLLHVQPPTHPPARPPARTPTRTPAHPPNHPHKPANQPLPPPLHPPPQKCFFFFFFLSKSTAKGYHQNGGLRVAWHLNGHRKETLSIFYRFPILRIPQRVPNSSKHIVVSVFA